MDITLIVIIAIFVFPLAGILWVASKEYRKTQKGLMAGDEKTIQNQLKSVELLRFLGGLIMGAVVVVSFGFLPSDNIPFIKLVNELGGISKVIVFGIGAFIFWMGNREAAKANDAQNKK